MKKFWGIILLVIIMVSLVAFKPKNSEVQSIEDTNQVQKLETKIETPKQEITFTIIHEVDQSKSYVVKADVLRIREQPNTESKILGKLYFGDEIKPTGQVDNGWYRISLNGKDAYVSGDFIVAVNPKDVKKAEVSNYLIVINSKYNTLNIYKDGELFEAYPCATGKKSTPSPEGNFQIVNKVVNPSWKGKVAGGDPSNPLGKRWMGLSVPGTGGSTYGIHGNSDESSIGKNVSGGCIRMHNADVEHVFEYLPVGTQVIISSADDYDINIAASYGYYINWWKGAERLLFHLT